MYKRFLLFFRQVSSSRRGDAHRIEFLRSNVIIYDWSKEAPTLIATNNLKFQELYSELEIVVQLECENRAAAKRDRSLVKPDLTTILH